MATQTPAMSSRHKRILHQDGIDFRDLDGDGILSVYEDWRRSPGERAVDLLGRLSLAEKAGLMLIGSHYMKGSVWVGPDGGLPDMRGGLAALSAPPAVDPTGQYIREDDSYTTRQRMTGHKLDRPRLYATGATRSITERHQRRFIVRDNPAAADLARWTNALQEIAEQTRFGIPVLFASNPRNHVSSGPVMGVAEGGGVFSDWPSEIGLAATMDPTLVREFAETARREWRAVGLHKVYGYMADVPSEPRWARFSGTLGEDPDLVATLIEELVLGFQGQRLGPDSVALTVKHFPGGGVRKDGHDPHFPWGRDNEYPTAMSLAEHQLPPFLSAIRAGVASVMPYYARPVNSSADQLPRSLWASHDEQFEEVAFAYNAAFLTGLLREQLGFRGYVNTDSGVLEGMAYGVEHLTPAERWAKIVRAGSDVVGDEADPGDLIAAVRDGLLEEHELDRSVTLLLAEMFALGLFENPYVDAEQAVAITGDARSRSRSAHAQRRSVVLMRHEPSLLPLRPGARVYAESFARSGAEAQTADLRRALGDRLGVDSITDDLRSSDYAVIWVRPELSLFGGDDREDAPLTLDPRQLGIDVERVQAIQATTPTVLVINFTNPWLLGALEPTAGAVVATFSLTADNLIAALSGVEPPTGRLPFSIPRNAETVAAAPQDTPGALLGEDYAYVDRAGSTYSFGFSSTPLRW